MYLTIHYVMATLSLIFFSIVYIPQIRLNYDKKINNLSLHFICMWLIADALNGVVAFVTDASIGAKLVPFFNTAFNTTLLVQKILYNKNVVNQYAFWLYIVGVGVYLVVVVLLVFFSAFASIIVHITSWIALLFFIMAPIIQIFKHYSKQSVEGISFTTFVLLILANITFITSVVFSDNNRMQSFLNNLPNILKSIILIQSYLVVLIQFKLYKDTSS